MERIFPLAFIADYRDNRNGNIFVEVQKHDI